MSLASSPDGILRAEDKALKMLFPAAEQPHSNTFDEYFHRELYESSDDDPIKCEDSEESPEMFAVMPPDELDPTPAVQHRSESSPQPWRKGLWCMNGRSNSQLKVEKTRKADAALPSIISPAHLVVNDNYALRSPRTTTQPHQTKKSSPTRFRHKHYSNSREEQRTQRGFTLSPSPMYSRSFVEDRSGCVDAWQQDFQDFNLQLDDDFTGSVAGNFEVTEDHHRSLRHSRRARMAEGPMRTEQRSTTVHHFGGGTQSYHQATHELSSILNANLNATEHNTFPGTRDNNMTSQFASDESSRINDWTTESLHSSNSSHNSRLSHNSHESHHANLYNIVPPQSWWSGSPGLSYNQMPQSTRGSYATLAQPKPRRVTHHAFGHDTDHDQGLGIEYPSSEEIGLAIPYHPPQLESSAMPFHHMKHANMLASYPPLPPPVGHDFLDESPFTTPRRTAFPSRTPSPVSPTHRPSRSLRQRSPSRREPSQHRRKSLHKAGPIKGTETPRHRSTSRPPRTPKTPKTPHDPFGSLDFVNFTPKDANKLLSDVAPSGSSKTRARREQEAREKRKKLSEAALDAVRSAGGDVEALEKAILA